MKLLTPEEAGKISPVKNGRTTLISSALLNLQPGAGLIVDRTDWKGLSSPYRIARHITKKKGFKYEYGRMPDGSGWFFKRLA